MKMALLRPQQKKHYRAKNTCQSKEQLVKRFRLVPLIVDGLT